MRSIVVFLAAAGCDFPEPGSPTAIDDDGDGFAAGEDCDDTDAARFPGAVWEIDADGDGWSGGSVTACEPPAGALQGPSAGADCDDTDAAKLGLVDTFLDGDADGYGVGAATPVCGDAPPGSATAGGDCDDLHPRTYPGASEDCGTADLDCVPDNDPTCRLSGTIGLNPIGGAQEYTPEIGVAPRQLDADARADVLLLGDFEFGLTTLIARRYELDDAGEVTAVSEYTSDATTSGTSLEFVPLPDLDGDGAPELWLVQGDYNNADTLIWDLGTLPLVGAGPLLPAQAFVTRSGSDPYSTVAGAVDAGELRLEGGLEVAMGAFQGSDRSQVEIWGGFMTGSGSLRTVIEGPFNQPSFGTDVLVADLDGDGQDDLGVTQTAYNFSAESAFVFRGPLEFSLTAADADATYETPAGAPYATGQLELAGDLLGDGRTWLYWGVPSLLYGGRVIAVPGDLTTNTPVGPETVESREVTAPVAFAGFGTAMDLLTDQTGDTVPDLLVGAPSTEYLVEAGVFLLDSNVVAYGSGPLDIDTSEVVAARFESGSPLGYQVSSAGDVDGDGAEDIWIGLDVAAFLIHGGVVP